MAEFDAKVTFISSLAPMKPLKPDVVRKLAPCWAPVYFKAKDPVVRQGEKADGAWAVTSNDFN